MLQSQVELINGFKALSNARKHKIVEKRRCVDCSVDSVSGEHRRCHLDAGHEGMHYWQGLNHEIQWNDKTTLSIG